MKIDFKISGKMCSNSLARADVLNISDYVLSRLSVGSVLGTVQGRSYVESAKGGKSFSSIAGINDLRGRTFDGPG
jgi:hypothetical protein